MFKFMLKMDESNSYENPFSVCKIPTKNETFFKITVTMVVFVFIFMSLIIIINWMKYIQEKQEREWESTQTINKKGRHVIKVVETKSTDWIKFEGVKQQGEIITFKQQHEKGIISFSPTFKEKKTGDVYYYEIFLYELDNVLLGRDISFGLYSSFMDVSSFGLNGYSIIWDSDCGIHDLVNYGVSDILCTFKTGDYVGCGFNPSTGEVFFTKNGLEFNKSWVRDFKKYCLVPTIIIRNKCLPAKPIIFSINRNNRNCWKSKQQRFKYHLMNTKSFLNFKSTRFCLDCTIICSKCIH